MIDRVRFAEIDREMSESIENRHVKFVVLFRSQAACPKLGYQCGAANGKLVFSTYAAIFQNSRRSTQPLTCISMRP